VVFAAIGSPWLGGCADMDQCSLGLCAKPCPATVPTGSTTTGGGGAGGEGGASVCSPRGTITSGN
jgi:hypothetical protein